MRWLILLASLWACGALADELPTNLLMKCEGKLSIITNPVSSLIADSKFETMLRLKDGELSDTNSIWLTTKGCQLRNSSVACSDNLTVPIEITGGSERRELKVFITRETGEYQFFLETWSFDGRNGKGKQTSSMKYHRSGICRPISKPIF